MLLRTLANMVAACSMAAPCCASSCTTSCSCVALGIGSGSSFAVLNKSTGGGCMGVGGDGPLAVGGRGGSWGENAGSDWCSCSSKLANALVCAGGCGAAVFCVGMHSVLLCGLCIVSAHTYADTRTHTCAVTCAVAPCTTPAPSSAVAAMLCNCARRCCPRWMRCCKGSLLRCMRAAACLTKGTVGVCFAFLFAAGCQRDCFVLLIGAGLCFVGDWMFFLLIVVAGCAAVLHANPCCDRYASNMSVAEPIGVLTGALAGRWGYVLIYTMIVNVGQLLLPWLMW